MPDPSALAKAEGRGPARERGRPDGSAWSKGTREIPAETIEKAKSHSRYASDAYQRASSLGAGGNSQGSLSISLRGFVSSDKNTTARNPSV